MNHLEGPKELHWIENPPGNVLRRVSCGKVMAKGSDMVEASRRSRMRLATERPTIPDPELRDFLSRVESLLGLGGTFRDGFVSSGTPNACPYTDNQLGYGRNGDGDIGSARAMYQAWHAIGAWNRGICAAFYCGPRNEIELNAFDCRVKLSKSLRTAALANLQYAGVLIVMRAAGMNITKRSATIEVETAHTAWAIELSNAEMAHDARWKTGTL